MNRDSALCEPTTTDIRKLASLSPSRTLRRICDGETGMYWYWPAEMATHAEGAAVLGIPYDRPPGAGEIVTVD